MTGAVGLELEDGARRGSRSAELALVSVPLRSTLYSPAQCLFVTEEVPPTPKLAVVAPHCTWFLAEAVSPRYRYLWLECSTLVAPAWPAALRLSRRARLAVRPNTAW